MRLVVLESPFAGDIQRNLAYARACVADCFNRREAAFASHLLYTQVGILDDEIPEQRALGIDAGLAWGAMAAATVVYEDLGITPGMEEGIERAKRAGRPVEYRSLELGDIKETSPIETPALNYSRPGDGVVEICTVNDGKLVVAPIKPHLAIQRAADLLKHAMAVTTKRS